jgi:hypothetical protein
LHKLEEERASALSSFLADSRSQNVVYGVTDVAITWIDDATSAGSRAQTHSMQLKLP